MERCKIYLYVISNLIFIDRSIKNHLCCKNNINMVKSTFILYTIIYVPYFYNFCLYFKRIYLYGKNKFMWYKTRICIRLSEITDIKLTHNTIFIPAFYIKLPHSTIFIPVFDIKLSHSTIFIPAFDIKLQLYFIVRCLYQSSV